MPTATKHKRLLLLTIAMCVIAAASVSTPGLGSKVYKWVDEDGKITYRDNPPPADSGGSTEVKDLNTDSNVITYETPPEPPKSAPDETPSASDGSTAGQAGKPDDTLEKGAAIVDERRRLEELRQADEQRRLEEEQRRIEQMPKRPLGF